MANQILPVHAQDITDRALISFKNQLVMSRYVDRQYDKLWGQTGAKRGTTINLRYPPQYELRRGNKAKPQGSNESYFPVTLGEPIGVDLDFTSQELLLTVDDFMNRFIKKATLPIAQGVDGDLTKQYKKIWNFTGTPGVVPTDIETYLAATTELAKAGAPIESDEWAMVLDYKSNQKIVKALSGQYNPQGNISKLYTSGRIVDAIGYKWSATQNIVMHTVGNITGSPLVNLGGQGANGQINFDYTGTATVAGYWKEGDVVQFTGVYGIKPNTVELGGTGESTGDLQNFVVTEDIDAATNAGTLKFAPAMITSGPFQNVTGLPADNAPITTFGHANAYANVITRQNLAFDRGCMVLGMVDLPLPGGMDMASRTTDEDGHFSMRFLRGFDITENTFISRLDVLHVAVCPRPQFGCRVVG